MLCLTQCLACATKSQRIDEMRIIDPVAENCFCESQIDMKKFQLVGNERFFRMIRDRERCIRNGLLEAEDER